MVRGPFFSTGKIIRFAQLGCTNRPYFQVVLAWNRAPLKHRPLEVLGVYDPMTNAYGEKVVALNYDRLRVLFQKEIPMSKPVAMLLGKMQEYHGLCDKSRDWANSRLGSSVSDLYNRVPEIYHIYLIF